MEDTHRDKTQTKQCDLCARSHFELLAERDRRGKPLETEVCTHCGLVGHRHIPTDEELDEFYSHQYRQEYHGEYEPTPRRVMRAWRNGERIRNQVVPYVPEGGRVLEVGAGIGCTVKQFQVGGFRARGIEPHEGFCQYGRRMLGADLREQFLFDLPQEPTCDLLLLVHVIEHFNSPRLALQHIYDLVRPGGYLYVECPNFEAPIATRARMFHFAHIHNFTPATLRMMARRCGFEQEQCFSASHDPNLQMLFRRAKPRLQVEAGSYANSVRAYQRYNNLSYHLRWNYLWPRAQKMSNYLLEHLVARRRVARLVEQYSRPAALPVGGESQVAARHDRAA